VAEALAWMLTDVCDLSGIKGLDGVISKSSSSSSDCRCRFDRSFLVPSSIDRFFPDDPLMLTPFGLVIEGELCKPFEFAFPLLS